MRYLIKFTKEEDIKFISHLDLMRTIQKIIRRSGIPMQYSKGFNPHMALSIAQPLSVGVYSSGEYMDIIVEDEINEEELVKLLNKNSSIGIKFISATKVINEEGKKKVPQGMALIDAARYTIVVEYDDVSKVVSELDVLSKEESWTTLKKSKKGEKEVNIRPMIHELKYWVKDNNLIINTLISAGSREHLSPELVVSYIKEHTTGAKEDCFVPIKREEMYFLKEDKLIPLFKCV